MSRSLLTCKPFLHCCVWWIFLNPGFKKSNTQTPPPLRLQSHIQEHRRTERQKELAVTSLLSMPKPIPHHFPHYCSFMAFKALYFIWDFTFPSSPLDMAHPAASNQEGNSMAGWVFRRHLDLRIARYSHWLLEDLVIIGHAGHPVPPHILVHHPVRMDMMGGRKEVHVWIAWSWVNWGCEPVLQKVQNVWPLRKKKGRCGP